MGHCDRNHNEPAWYAYWYYLSEPISLQNQDSILMLHRCDFCGEILREVPFKCKRCGDSFCTNHHHPENHQCPGLHSYKHKPHHKYCGNCGRELTGMPYKCHRCGVIFCDNYRLPENHGCKVTPPDSTPIRPPKKKLPSNLSWKKFGKQLTLKNFTIISILFMLVGFLFSYYPIENYQGLFQSILGLGVLCFLLAYFFYAVKCWGATNQICAVLMLTLPLLAYFLSTSKIPDSTTNTLFYLAIQFCFYAIISVILLYISDKVKMGIEQIVYKRDRKSRWYFTPELSYSVIGVLFVSLLAVNYGSTVLFFDNTASMTQSLQSTNSPTYPTSDIVNSPTMTYSQISQIVPTIQPAIVKNIESTVGNSPPAVDIQTLELRVHELINQQRRSNGLSSMSYDSSLASIARKHSADMAKNNYFSHYNLQGLDPTGRGNLVGYSCYKNYGSYYTTGIAENIMQNNLYDSVTYYNGIPRYAWNTQEEIAQSTVDGWMTSPGHRQNILTSTYNREGIGVAIASDNKVYITQDFC